MNCTDSGLENLRAISIASLMTTARGVFGYPRNSATAARHNVPIDGRHALHAPMLRMAFNQSIDVGGSIGRGAEQVSAKPLTSSPTSFRSAQNVRRTSSAPCRPMSA